MRDLAVVSTNGRSRRRCETSLWSRPIGSSVDPCLLLWHDRCETSRWSRRDVSIYEDDELRRGRAAARSMRDLAVVSTSDCSRASLLRTRARSMRDLAVVSTTDASMSRPSSRSARSMRDLAVVSTTPASLRQSVCTTARSMRDLAVVSTIMAKAPTARTCSGTIDARPRGGLDLNLRLFHRTFDTGTIDARPRCGLDERNR